MISFEPFTPVGGVPIYRQILHFIKREAVAGAVRDGDELPSRRVLSALLGINPNTVQKAFRLLEEEGLIESRTGAKSVVTLDGGKLERLRAELLTEDVRRIARAMKQMAVSKEEALRLVGQYWDEE